MALVALWSPSTEYVCDVITRNCLCKSYSSRRSHNYVCSRARPGCICVGAGTNVVVNQDTPRFFHFLGVLQPLHFLVTFPSHRHRPARPPPHWGAGGHPAKSPAFRRSLREHNSKYLVACFRFCRSMFPFLTPCPPQNPPNIHFCRSERAASAGGLRRVE